MPEKSSFHLKKWYFDSVDAEGRTIIAYSASLKWRGIRVPYSSYLHFRKPADSQTESRFTQAGDPKAYTDHIELLNPSLRLSGQWTAHSTPLRQRLYADVDGYVDWHCLQPAGQCGIQLNQEPALTGWGYVECLEMTVPPWHLGLRELRWGRFADPEFPVVWIDWIGELTRRWIFADGQLLESGKIDDTTVDVPANGWTLQLESPVVLEEEEKMQEVLRGLTTFIPGVRQLAPLRFVQARETKWRSAGILHRKGLAPRTGWVIHELVKF